jgi:murein DD-endopeptidase MepM/ murein hydrolase activator NlpD
LPSVRGKGQLSAAFFGTSRPEFVASRPQSRVEGLDLDHGKRRGAYRASGEADHIDLGHEPPLSVDGESNNPIDRRRVSVQWFSGTILTGLCGAALMGGAVFASLDGQSNFATVPERVQLATRGSGDRTATARKADRLPAPSESNNQRRVIRDTQTSRVGNREIVRVRAFVRVAGNLALSTSELTANIPAFNPQKMLLAEAAPGAPAVDDAPDAEIDAEVSFVTADLANLLPRAKIAAVLSNDDVLFRVRAAANWTGSTTPPASPDLPRNTRMAYAAEGNLDPYAGFEARIAPENVTLLPKTTAQTTGGTAWVERAVHVRRGESVTSILRELGARPDDIKAIVGVLGPRGRDGGVRENQKLRVLLAPTDDPKLLQPIRVVIANDSSIEAVVAWSDLGRYVQVDVRNMETEIARARQQQQQDDEEDDGRGVRLYQSIYETALRNHIPRPLIEELIRIYSYDVDFQRRVQPGDSFEVLFAADDENSDAKGEVLFAALTTGGEARRFYRFQSSDDGLVDYYDETGKSAKKFLVRKPLADGIMRSGFGNRNHPILRFTKMHTGVDWAAPMGTPIYASGNGVVDKMGWEGGYGRYIRIRHANGYQTAYGHMSAFARNISEGKRVRQGQVIGYVGSTGLSTGAHLHYEIIVNGRHVDPMRIRLPRGRVLEGGTLASFERERERLDNMITRAGPTRVTPPRMAQSSTGR